MNNTENNSDFIIELQQKILTFFHNFY